MANPLLVVIPLSAADLSLADSMLRHISFLGQIPLHAVLFVADNTLTQDQINPILELAKPIFPAGGALLKTPAILSPETPAYPHRYNFRFETAARQVASNQKVPWLWLDPRCVPIHKGWLFEIEREYYASNKPIMGMLMTPELHGTAQRLISGVGVYPPEIPKRMFQLLIAQRNVDFEKSCAAVTVPIAHPSTLIWVHALNGTNAMPSPPPIAALVHTKVAKFYAAKLRGEPVNIPDEKPVAPPKPPDLLVKPPQDVARAAYYHSGDLGDIIYGLAAIRLAGGGKLLLGPRIKNTEPPANPIRQDQFDRFCPLLEIQPYLSRVSFTETYPGTDTAFDLSIFRKHWGDKALRSKTGINSLVRMHCHTLGVDEKFRPDDPWLTVPDPIQTGLYTVHRSPRYRNEAFQWQTILKRYKGKLLFVGLPQEHADFQRTFGVRTAFWSCYDFLELARVIAGSLGFIGNQSFPNSLACAMGQKVIQESWDVSPDCIFVRPNFLTQPFNEPALTKWEASAKMAVGAPPPKLVVEIVNQPRRKVSTAPVNGLIELGPLENAFGLGDTLTITPLAEKLGQRAVVCLPSEIEKFAPLFNGLCPVRITDDYPIFPNPGGERFIESKLRMFGFQCEDGKTPPVVRITETELAEAKQNLEKEKKTKPPLILHTTCAKQWREIRSRPPKFFKPITDIAAKKWRLTDCTGNDLRFVAAYYAAVRRYFGVNTGNWHLAMAVGCKCLVIDADECDGYNPALWRYSMPTVEYVGFDEANILEKLNWL